MMRLPSFTYRAPRTVREAADLLAAAEGGAMLVAGGTDILPNMKRRQQVPATLIGLRQVAELRGISNGDGLTIGAATTLTSVMQDARVRAAYPGLWQAAAQIATPHLRNMGTIGGNVCLDTRCNYYDQNYEWRKAINFCMKKDGDICWVATSSPRCLAVSSTDTAPALIALGASVTLASPEGAREVPLADFYQNDGINYLTRRATEILTSIRLPSSAGWRSTYWKLRRRGSFDFPVLSVGAAVKLAADGSVAAARIVLGAVSSRPMEAPDAAASLVGQPFTDAAIAGAADLASVPARPMDNTDFGLVWRKRVTRAFVTYALRELRGDDVRALRLQVARQPSLV
jgi:4-hydroxybenzoyl-CoA reductase subunit beta